MINIGGLLAFTAMDYPEKYAATIFCNGCPWDCVYCHNKELKSVDNDRISWVHVKNIILSRSNILEAVVFSGGEPLLQKNLLDAILEFKDKGFKIGLHTTGMYFDRFKKVLPYVGWVGFDIKHQFKQYPKVTNVENSGFRSRQSADHLIKSGVDYEFRTTVDPSIFIDGDGIVDIARDLSYLDAQKYVIQKCVCDHPDNIDYDKLKEEVEEFIPNVEVR